MLNKLTQREGIEIFSNKVFNSLFKEDNQNNNKEIKLKCAISGSFNHYLFEISEYYKELENLNNFKNMVTEMVEFVSSIKNAIRRLN